MVEISGLYTTLGQTPVLKGIDLSVDEGEIISVIGPSGSGKSTLLRSINMLVRPHRGKLTLDELTVDVQNATKSEIFYLRRNTAMVFQLFDLFRNKTALENILLPMTIVRRLDYGTAKQQAEEILELVGLQDKRDSYPSKLSGGEQQRIGIGRALAVNAKVILFDEPTTSLDPELIDGILEIIRSLSGRNITMIIVTHEIGFAREISDRIVFMDNGTIVDQGTSQYILEQCTNPRILDFFRTLRQ